MDQRKSWYGTRCRGEEVFFVTNTYMLHDIKKKKKEKKKKKKRIEKVTNLLSRVICALIKLWV